MVQLQDGTIPALRGTAQEIGTRFAALNKEALLKRYNLWLEDCLSKGLAEADLIKGTARYVAAAQEIAPWLLEEAAGIADFLEVPSPLFISSIALQKLNQTDNIIPKDDDCTSIMVVGAASSTGESILHKNRDNDIGAQSLYIKEVFHEGKALNRFIGTSYLYDFGVTAFINDKGVAGAVNAGEFYPNPSTGGLTTPTILRIAAEKASCCEDILQILLPILSKPNYYCTHRNSGSIWLFVDREKGLIIENTAHLCAFEYIYDGIAVRANDYILLNRDYAVGNLGRERPGGLVRRERVLQRLQAKKGSITPETVIGAARDWEPPVDNSSWSQEEIEAYLFSNICKVKTVSGFTGVVRKDHTPILSQARVMNGHPNNVYSLPIYVGCGSLLQPHIDGEMSTLSYRLAASNPIGENKGLKLYDVERNIQDQLQVLEKEALDLLKDGREEEAKERVTGRCNEISQDAVHLMRSAVDTITL